jgi:hypothetical protein
MKEDLGDFTLIAVAGANPVRLMVHLKRDRDVGTRRQIGRDFDHCEILGNYLKESTQIRIGLARTLEHAPARDER